MKRLVCIGACPYEAAAALRPFVRPGNLHRAHGVQGDLAVLPRAIGRGVLPLQVNGYAITASWKPFYGVFRGSMRFSLPTRAVARFALFGVGVGSGSIISVPLCMLSNFGATWRGRGNFCGGLALLTLVAATVCTKGRTMQCLPWSVSLGPVYSGICSIKAVLCGITAGVYAHLRQKLPNSR